MGRILPINGSESCQAAHLFFGVCSLCACPLWVPISVAGYQRYGPRGATDTCGNTCLQVLRAANFHKFDLRPGDDHAKNKQSFCNSPPHQRRCRFLALNVLPSNALPSNVVADMRSKQILHRIGKQKLVG
jgi:hypothetical protein